MGTKADNRDGSCREILSRRLKGKSRVQFTYEDEFCRKTRVSRVFPTKTEGKDFLRSLLHGAKFEETKKSRDLTLGDWFDWLVEHDWPR